jgi:hypothetical protein
VILLRRALPPAFILASRRSFRMRACSAALDGGVLGSEDICGGVSAISNLVQPCKYMSSVEQGLPMVHPWLKVVRIIFSGIEGSTAKADAQA